MRKWWNDLRRYLLRQPNAGGRLTADTSPLGPVPDKVLPEYEPTVQQAIRWYGRRKVRREVKAVHRRMITERPNGRLAKQIRRIFSGEE